MNRSVLATVALGAMVSLSVASCGDDEDGGDGAGGTASGGSSSGGSSQGGSSGKGGSSATGGANAGGANAGGAGGETDAEGGTGGSEGGAGGSPEICEDVLDSDCDDSNADSIDFMSGEFGVCGHWFGANNGSDGWVVYGAPGALAFDTFSVDVETNLSWAMLAGSYNRANGFIECNNLTRGGSGSWRPATIDEARSLAAGCANTEAGGDCPVAHDTCTIDSCDDGVECESCPGGVSSTSPRADDLYCRVEVNICFGFHTSSVCTNCATASAWSYGPVNGILAPKDITDALNPVCVASVPRGRPCLDPTP